MNKTFLHRQLALLLFGLVTLPVLAQRPPEGEARPPFHIRGNAATAPPPSSLSPATTLSVYGFTSISNQASGQTIAIIDTYDDPNIESDLGVFSAQYGLPSCTTAHGCFKKTSPAGRKPRTDSGWSLEISLDVEWAHAIAPQAKILLVEAASASFTDLLNAVKVAVTTPSDCRRGTTLSVSGTAWAGETAWSGSGGGVSVYESEPGFQSGYPIPATNNKRGVPDVAYDADPNTGYAVYDTVSYQGQSGWLQVGGTSAGAPQWAALLAMANSMRAALPTPKGVLSTTAYTVYAAAAQSTVSADLRQPQKRWS